MTSVSAPERATRATGWRCLVCSATRDIAEPFPWRCPNATAGDRHHVLSIIDASGMPDCEFDPLGNPFVTYDAWTAWAAYADAHGIDRDARRSLVGELDDGVRRTGGVSFVPTPLERSAALSTDLGFTDGGGIWVKDQTGDVGGSHKARHLATILLHLRAAERVGHLTERPPLAIASCGNAALAAATLAAAVDWPLDVYVPTWMNPAFGTEMERLGARLHRCERRAGDPSGDPTMHRFRDAVAAGALPFSVQGTENALALDGGRTLGWELMDQAADAGLDRVDRVYVQVGGGAFAACIGRALGDHGLADRLHTVQAAGCAPLARAWERAGDDLEHGTGRLGARWSELMTPWPDPHSLADGILDDETYDWLGIVDAVGAGGHPPVVASESDVVAAHQLASAAGFDASATASAGLAGVLADIDSIAPTERVVVIMSGVAR